ncbi:MAG: hypothetical protein IJC01_02855, partial [Clostridia bacterium]|nr:hypothetical protein [Clostridia bacterium]
MKAKKKSFGIQLISILVVVAIISVGFAAWIITSPIAGDSVQGGFIAQDYIDNTFTISIDIENVDADDPESADKQLTFGKPDEATNTASTGFFTNSKAYKFNWFSFEAEGNTATPTEVMAVQFTVTIDPTEDGEKKIEDLLLNRSVMISLTLNNAQQRWVAAANDVAAHYEEVKEVSEGNYDTDSTSTAAYALYSKANKLTVTKTIDNKQVVFDEAQFVAEPKMTCTYGEDVTKESDYTTKIYNTLDPTQFPADTVKTEWADDNAISIVLPKDAFVKSGTNFVATVKLSIDWGTYFNIYYTSNDDYTIVKEPVIGQENDNTPCISNVNPYYFFNLQNIYTDGNTWIQQAKEAIDTIFALNYTAANDETPDKVSGSGVQYQLSIHPIPYVD